MEREVLIYQGAKTLVQRGGGCLILGNIQVRLDMAWKNLYELRIPLPMAGGLDQMAFKDCC